MPKWKAALGLVLNALAALGGVFALFHVSRAWRGVYVLDDWDWAVALFGILTFIGWCLRDFWICRTPFRQADLGGGNRTGPGIVGTVSLRQIGSKRDCLGRVFPVFEGKDKLTHKAMTKSRRWPGGGNIPGGVRRHLTELGG